MRRCAAVLISFILCFGSVQAQAASQNGVSLVIALTSAAKGDWDAAKAVASQISDPVAVDIIEWRRLRDGVRAFADYQGFLAKNPEWPGLAVLRKRGEAAIPKGHNSAEVFAYFKGNPPQSGTGSLRLAEAFMKDGKITEARREVVRAWTTFSLTKDEQSRLLKKFKTTLAPHHIARLDMLLWRGRSDEAQAMFANVSDDYVILAKARIGLRKLEKNPDGLVRAVPKSVQNDPGLAYERFVWRARKNLDDSARDLLIAQSVSKKALGQPEDWARRRRDIARQEMRNGNNKRAYQIASQHFLTEGSDYADLEWLAGYIALRKLKKPELAITHFNRFRAAVATPISYGRAGYWLGRAYDAAGDKANAQKAYLFGAEHQTSFYGQLAAEKAGVGPDESLAGLSDEPDWHLAPFLTSSVIRAALLFHEAGLSYETERFVRHHAESLDLVGNQQLAAMVLDLDRPSIAVRLSKQAAGMGFVMPKSYFPLTDLAKLKTRLKPEVAMSIARRESELDPTVISHAGARGLMQVMPNTARKVAKEIGQPYSLSKLSNDWEYNATVGSAYLADQLEAFNGSFVLAFAAYNSGPGRAKRWSEVYGDPTSSKADQVDWIEHIPFNETRNYVMRVMESLHIYRARIAGKTPPLQLSKDLRKG